MLIVDDHANNVLRVSRLLASWGCECGNATDGVGALVALQEAAAAGQPYDAAVLDGELRDVPLQAIVERIKGDPRIATTSLLAMAALGRRHGGTEGVSAWVTKPIRRQHLRDSLERALGRLPMGKIAGDGPPAAGDAAVAVAPAHARILLAEDNEVNQKVALAILGKLGYHADLATNGREALAALLTNRYDLVLMDCHMPDMDGYEASRAIRRQAAPLCQVPIVALTANAMEGDEGRCREAGMDGYVAKPVTRRALSAALERWLSAR